VRRVLVLVSAIVLVDTSFYAAITPLLPYYADQHDLTKAGAGVLTAAYPAGTMLASLPAGWLGARIGAQRMLLFGLGLLAVSSFTFGHAGEVWLLDTARFAQGIGGAISWTGGMGWLSNSAPRETRSQVIGTAFGFAIGGALLGPVLGAVAREVGPDVAFSGVAFIALVLLVLAAREHVETIARREPGSFLQALRQPLVALGAWLIGVSALLFGVLDVLLPLELGRLGAGGATIGAAFLAAAALEAIASPLAGRYTDRHGWQGLARIGLAGTAAVALVASLPDTVSLLFLVVVVAGPVVGMLWVPGLTLLANGSDEARIDHSYAYAVMNLLWAMCQAIAAAGGGALARAAGDFAAYAVVAAFAVATLAVTISNQRARV
jgi:MFS family permease